MGKRHCGTMEGNTGIRSNFVERNSGRRSGLFAKRADCGRKSCYRAKIMVLLMARRPKWLMFSRNMVNGSERPAHRRRLRRRLLIGTPTKPLAGGRLLRMNTKPTGCGGSANIGRQISKRNANYPATARIGATMRARFETWNCRTSAVNCGEEKTETEFGGKARPHQLPMRIGRRPVTA
jgi:hypothetical protein